MPRCLIVDDHRDGREGFAEYLRGFGFEVDECVDGETAWEALSTGRPDVLVLDLQLPGLSGWDLIERIRNTAELQALPVVAFSACVFPEDRARAVEAGCDVFITKPAMPGDVLNEIRRLLRRRATAEPAHGTADA